MEYARVRYPNALPGYLENQASTPFYHTNLETNLEGISLKPDSQTEKSPLERMLSDKAKTSKAKVRALLYEIRLREALDTHILKKVDDEICEQHSSLMQLENFNPQYSPNLAKHIINRKTELDANVLDLEREKRKEYLECWRDLMFLKTYLLSALKDYWDLVKKRDVLSYDPYQKNEDIKGY